ncbi:ImpB/MucB/SamB family protein [Bifidobacterium callitrichos]|uniref:ImpB/MucB/SamB family protein n=1 Tax=Bifidobacterium callitrichos TaxID=762209 RepID=UPI0011B20AF7|nr:ImpB/MucB/SamB family protein [Bifidobacterium callitrichos]
MRNNTTLTPVDEFDWQQRLSELNSLPWKEKEIDGIHYDVILNQKYPILTILEQFDPAFMRVINEGQETVVDYINDLIGTGGTRLANSSALAFFPKHSLVAYVNSASTAKSIRPVEKCLNHYWHVNDSWEWELEAVSTKDSIERFNEELKGASSIETSFCTTRTLFSLEPPANSPVFYFNQVSEDIGDNLKVEIKISLSDRKNDHSATKKLKAYAASFIPEIAQYGTKAIVRGQDLNEALIDLNLIKHNIVERAEMEVPDNKPLKFSDLINHLIKVCTERQEYLYEINEERKTWRNDY